MADKKPENRGERFTVRVEIYFRDNAAPGEFISQELHLHDLPRKAFRGAVSNAASIVEQAIAVDFDRYCNEEF